MDIVEKIKGICKSINTNYVFRYEAVDYMNLKSDLIPRDERFVFFEAIRSGRFQTINKRLSKVYRVDLYFCAFIPLDLEHYDDDDLLKTKSDIIAEIESEIVTPLVKHLESYHKSSITDGIDFGYPNASRFDGNEVSVRIGFRYALPVC